MLYIDTCVLLALLTPEVHSAEANAFMAQAKAPLAISSWSVTELHSALGLKVRSKALNQAQAEIILQGLSAAWRRACCCLNLNLRISAMPMPAYAVGLRPCERPMPCTLQSPALEVPPSAAWMLRLLQRQNSWA